MSSEVALFWLAAVVLGYTYAGYPALVWTWARLRARPTRPAPVEPSVTVLVVAHDEAPRIGARIANLLSLEYPRPSCDIVVGVDGSSDGTAERARAYEGAGVRVVAFARRRGKPAVLNELVPTARGEIVVLADARQRFEESALRALVRPFGDPGVGAVSGELILARNEQGTAVGDGVGAYWRYEKFIRKHESRIHSTIGATGAIYAIRRELFESIPEDTIADDVVIPMRIVRRGYRVLFEPGARAYDRVAATAREEFTRKVRTIAGAFQLFARERWLLSPLRNRLWLQTVSHKGIRLLTPFCLMAALGANLSLVDQPFYLLAFAAQICFYASAAAGCVLRNSRCRLPLLTVPYVVCLLSWVTVVAFLRFLGGRQPVTWQRVSS